MSKVIAIIGGGYGDEGKGLMTDYFSSRYDDAIVIRSNGGAQAGHTVETPDGKRHIFSHFGSGTINGTPTFLSKHFVCNPILFVREYKLFTETFGITPVVYIDPQSLISTPYDMLINQKMEFLRGDDIHGSCGVGFGETIERQLINPESTITMQLLDTIFSSGENIVDKIYKHCRYITNNYLSQRIDLETIDHEFLDIIMSEDRIASFAAACRFMFDNTTLLAASNFEDSTLIFEGAQGLLLDMDCGYFPYVTRSNCGMKNVSDILRTIPGEHDITVNYVTRAYTTRHGAGPLNYEDLEFRNRHNIVDETNILNQFQGSLRFAPLDLDLFNSITDKDFMNYAPRSAKKTTTITCLDQLHGETTWYAKGVKRFMTADIVRRRWGEKFDFGSFGPTRNDIKALDK